MSRTELTAELKGLSWDKHSVKEGGNLDFPNVVFLCNRYSPWCISTTPIVLQQVRSWIRQNWDKKTRQKGSWCVILFTDKRLKEKLGTQRTFSRVKWAESCIVPMCVTLTVSPLSNSTTHCVIDVILVNMETEHTMQSDAPVSMTQTLLSKAVLFMTLAEKIECLELNISWGRMSIPAKGVEAWEAKETLLAIAIEF